MDATEVVVETMLRVFSVLQTARTSHQLFEIPNLPVYAQKRCRPDAAYS